MFEEISGALDGNLSGASSALAGDLASGNAGQFKVDLQALYDYFFGVYDLLDQVSSQTNKMPSDPYSQACFNDSEIPGVAAAIQSTVNGALSTSEQSMVVALRNIGNLLAKHLTAVQQVYTSYVHADTEGAVELTQASNASAAKITVPGSTSTPVETGTSPVGAGGVQPI